MVLRQQQSVEEPADGELAVSDDEVEVVEEWTLPAGPMETVSEPLDCSPLLYVPVIQRPADQSPKVSDLRPGAQGQVKHSPIISRVHFVNDEFSFTMTIAR